MDIMELGAIGELVGGIAVVASLIYVGLQVRQSNRIAKNSAAQAFRQINSDFLLHLASDPGQTQLYLAGLADRGALPNEERLRFDMIMLHIFRVLESQFLEHQNGHLGGDILESYERSFAPVMRQPGGLTAWRRLQTQMTSGFQRYVNENFTDHEPQEV